MKANKAEQHALITLLNRIYGEIRALEQAWDLRVSVDDFRPRIEYFHDAVRALTAGGGGNKRLAVELLAYDISMLRHIQAHPMTRPKGTKSASAGTDMVPYSGATRESTRGADASVKTQLADLYKNYGLIFAALLSDTAERDHMSRVDEKNTEVEDLAALAQEVKLAAKKEPQIDLAALVESVIDDPNLENKILFYVDNYKQKKRLMAEEALRKLKEFSDGIDKEIKSIEKAHFTYVTSQLAIYEGAKDLVKKMALQGMNIVGNFVQAAVNEAARGQRGR